MDRLKIITETNILFRKHGIRAVTMDTIAKTLSISKRTLYQTFKDKDALLYECILHESMEYKKKAMELLNSASNIIEGMQIYGAFHFKKMTSIKPYFINELQKYHPSVYEKISQRGEIRNSEISYTILKRARNEGYFRKDFNIEVANDFMHHAGEFIMKNRQAGTYPDLELLTGSVIPFLKGLCTSKGLEAVEKMKFE